MDVPFPIPPPPTPLPKPVDDEPIVLKLRSNVCSAEMLARLREGAEKAWPSRRIVILPRDVDLVSGPACYDENNKGDGQRRKPVPALPPSPPNETTTRGWPSRFLVTPKRLSKVQKARLRQCWESRYTGSTDTSRVLRCGSRLPDWLDLTLKAVAFLGLWYGVAVAWKMYG